MKFKEKECIEMTKTPRIFIYFLLDKEEVVYVGKTNKGMGRVYSHANKQFDRIFILPCAEYKLDELESKYIIKYKPKYNKIPNRQETFSIRRAMAEITDIYLKNSNSIRKKCNKRQFLKMMNALDITVSVFNNETYISRDELSTIENAIEDYLMGENKNETFNLWI